MKQPILLFFVSIIFSCSQGSHQNENSVKKNNSIEIDSAKLVKKNNIITSVTNDEKPTVD